MKGCRPFSEAELSRILSQLAQRRDGLRDVALLTLGVQTGFRISELLSVRLGDIIIDGAVVRHLSVARKKMKKKTEGRTMPLTDATRRALGAWLRELHRRGYMQPDDFVFQSTVASNKPISKSRAWNIIHGAARACGIDGSIGTHSMRKTFADRMYEKFKQWKTSDATGMGALRAVSKALGHANINNTDKYLSFREEDIDAAIFEIWGESDIRVHPCSSVVETRRESTTKEPTHA